MRNARTLLWIAVAAVALAGCTNPSQSTNNTTTTTTTTPTTTTSPTITTPAVNNTTLGAVTSIALLPRSGNATAGGNATVCWRVEGLGNVKHTAVHYDNVSHNATNATFDQYKGGAAYPDNATALDPDGYDLPGTFCTSVPVDEGTVYFRAHVIDVTGGKGKVSEEGSVTANATAG